MAEEKKRKARAHDYGFSFYCRFVEETRPYYERALLSVAPILYGAGVKGKVGMSMSYGVPVVVTPIAAEGMKIVDGTHALVAAAPEAFAAAVVRIHKSPALWRRLRDGGFALIRSTFSEHAAENALREILDLE